MNRNVIPFLTLAEIAIVKAGSCQDLPINVWDALFGTAEQAAFFIQGRTSFHADQ
jgi:hypothetical protein